MDKWYRHGVCSIFYAGTNIFLIIIINTNDTILNNIEAYTTGVSVKKSCLAMYESRSVFRCRSSRTEVANRGSEKSRWIVSFANDDDPLFPGHRVDFACSQIHGTIIDGDRPLGGSSAALSGVQRAGCSTRGTSHVRFAKDGRRASYL